MVGYDIGPRILSRPIRIHWAGWETDTYKLQKSGWRLSAMQDIQGNSLQMAFEFGQGRKMQAITETIPFYYERMLDMRDYRAQDELRGLSLRVVKAISDELMIHISGQLDAPGFGPIDAEPRYTTSTIQRLEDFAHFAGPLIRTNEVIVPEKSVPELMEMILKLQQPARIERIKDELRGEHRVEQKFHAQIISLRGAA